MTYRLNVALNGLKESLKNGCYKKTRTFYFSKMSITEAGVGVVHTQHTQTVRIY